MAYRTDQRSYSKPSKRATSQAKESAGHLKDGLTMETSYRGGRTAPPRLYRNVSGQNQRGTGSKGLYD